MAKSAQRVMVARQSVTDALGVAAMIDAAAVIANFQRMVRIADSSGIPLDEPVLMMTQGIRQQLGINQFAAAANSPELGWGKRILGGALAPFATRIMRRMAKGRSQPNER